MASACTFHSRHHIYPNPLQAQDSCHCHPPWYRNDSVVSLILSGTFLLAEYRGSLGEPFSILMQPEGTYYNISYKKCRSMAILKSSHVDSHLPYCLSGPVAALEPLPFLDPSPGLPSSALRSRKLAHRSDRDSLLADVGVGSEKKSVFKEGVLGVLWNGECGRRRVLLEAPGLANPACSRCSSVQFKSPAMTCKIWNFLGSDRSRARNCKKWLVTICLMR